MSVEGELIEAGCDYIAATCSSKRLSKRFASLGENLLLKERAKGNDIRRWAQLGYQGFSCGSLQVGRREDGWFMRASGSRAYTDWKNIYPLSTNVSRLDTQVTVRYEQDVDDLIRQQAKRAKRHRLKRRRGANVDLRDSTDSTTTLYIGLRTSDRFLRAYNKFGETKLEHYRQCLRFEAEFKRDLAVINALQLSRSESVEAAALGITSVEFAAKGCNLIEPGMGYQTASVPRSRSNHEKKLAWLASCVRPSLEALERAGRLEDVLKALGLPTVRKK